MASEYGSYIARLDRSINQELEWERRKRANRELSPCVLTDDDLIFVEYTIVELRSLGSHDALFGDAARYPSSATYMLGYKRRQEDGTFGTGQLTDSQSDRLTVAA